MRHSLLLPTLALFGLALLSVAVLPGYLDLLDRVPPEPIRHLTPAAAPPGEGPGPAPRLLWIVVDGLRDDALDALPALRQLGVAGSRLRYRVASPSFSRPAYATLATGAPPAHHGVRTNRGAGPVLLDTLFARLAAAGGQTRMVLQRIDWWARVVDLPAAQAEVVPETSRVGARARALLAAAAPADRLLLVHFTEVDHLSHRHGARSPEVRAELARVDAELAELLAQRPPLWSVLVLSDHGHRVDGGHGGGEAEVVLAPALLAGPDLAAQPGTWERPLPADATDIAPTLAALLGCAPPAQAEGQILAELFRPEAQLRSAPLAAELRRGQARLVAAGLPSAEAEAGLLVRARWVGGAGALVVVLGLGLLAGPPLRRSFPPRQLVGWILLAASFPVLTLLLWEAVGSGWSFSAIPLKWIFARRLGGLMVLGASPGVVLFLWHGRRGPRLAPAQLRLLGLLPGLVTLPLVLGSLAWAGVAPGMHLADPAALFLPLVTGPLLAASWLGGGLLLLGRVVGDLRRAPVEVRG
ncbi:MAG: alkaline phosphatase family protein [Myxococcota bacterium]|nr:alkaline phosphatase family protein [Myxococcota bacterium]